MTRLFRSGLLVVSLAATADAQSRDTTFMEVGSAALDARIMKPHAARVRVYRGDTLVQQWLNELTLGDSAGRPVQRWVTTSERVPSNPNRPLSVLRQTYDGITLAPLGYSSTSSAGAATHLAIDGVAVRGTKRLPNDTVVQNVAITLDRPGFFLGASDLVPIAAGLKTGSILVAPFWTPASQTSEYRVFRVMGDTTVNVESTLVRARKVEERNRTDGVLRANWYLLTADPYMVYGEIPLPDGRMQRMTEVSVRR